MARQAGGPLREQLLRLLVRLLKRTPKLALRFVLTVISPGTHLKRLALVSALQLLASLVHYAQKTWTRGLIWKDRTFARQANARTYEEWRVATQELELERPRETDLALPEEQESFFEQLRERATNYAELRLAGDEYGLMFHLRSELMRQQLGNRGYSREGSTWLRKHASARLAISQYQSHVCDALRYIASGAAPNQSHARHRLAFINETRHAYGRTALLLSGGGAFGVKHIGVVAALHRAGLVPRILSGTSAGSIVAAFVCVKTDSEMTDILFDDPEQRIVNLIASLPFFDVKRGESENNFNDLTAGLVAAANANLPPPNATPNDPRTGGRGAAARASDVILRDATRPLKNVARKRPLLESRVLRDALKALCGELTFLEAFDRTGRVLNIVVTRSDGRAPPLLCNYLTTPQMIVYSASLASCSIPGVFDAVELMAKNREGHIVSYFKTGKHRWTDGGLQADLPKQRLTELFNVNQFIVSQVNPVAPLVVPAPAPPLVTEILLCLKHQLLGALSGLGQFAHGTLIRPLGFRAADLLMQEYEGTVTIYPRWSIWELFSFLSNFNQARVTQYILDGERAAWPHLEVVHSLTEIEYTLDAVAAELQCAIRGKLPRPDSKAEYGALSHPSSRPASNADLAGSPSRQGSTGSLLGGPSCGRLPSYVSLDAFGTSSNKPQPLSPRGVNGKPAKLPTPSWAREPAPGTAPGAGVAVSGTGLPRKGSAIPGVASHASLFNMGLEAEDEPPASVGLLPF